MKINNWDIRAVIRTERTWGSKLYDYDLFSFDTAYNEKSILDLGCGFGRFYAYIKETKPPTTYLGYDSSEAMILRAKELHPESTLKFEVRDICKEPFNITTESILCNAVLIHLNHSLFVRGNVFWLHFYILQSCRYLLSNNVSLVDYCLN